MIQAGWEEQEDKRWKYVDGKGNYVCSNWVDYNGNRYYMDSTGYMVTKWNVIKKDWYYFETNIDKDGHEHGGQLALGWREINGLWYYLNPNSGKMMTGFQTINEKNSI